MFVYFLGLVEHLTLSSIEPPLVIENAFVILRVDALRTKRSLRLGIALEVSKRAVIQTSRRTCNIVLEVDMIALVMAYG